MLWVNGPELSLSMKVLQHIHQNPFHTESLLPLQPSQAATKTPRTLASADTITINKVIAYLLDTTACHKLPTFHFPLAMSLAKEHDWIISNPVFSGISCGTTYCTNSLSVRIQSGYTSYTVIWTGKLRCNCLQGFINYEWIKWNSKAYYRAKESSEGRNKLM